MTIRSAILMAVASALVAVPAAVHAQVIGTFSWQTQPYCNVVTVQVVQQGPLYQLLGHDDQCGAGPAPVTGTAVPVGGSVAFGMTAALPNGRAAHLSASISLAVLSGTWSDADGNTGPFVFSGRASGSPRPGPVGATAITTNQFAQSVYAGPGVATTVARSDHDHDTRYYTKAQVDAVAAEVVTVPPNSPSSFTFVAEGQPLLDDSFTTTRPGHLLVTKMVGALTSVCTFASDSRIVFLRVDGVAVKSSALFFTTSSIGTVRLMGVTDVVVPAGAHTVDVATECLGASVWGGASYLIWRDAAIVVLP